MIHICTTDSLAAGCEQFDIFCPICDSKMTSTWVGATCKKCGFETDYPTGRNMLHIREKLGLSRDKVAKVLGVTRKTLKKYEFGMPSQAAWERFKDLIKETANPTYEANATAPSERGPIDVKRGE